jgi:RNA methyltransferase, TrmH family
VSQSLVSDKNPLLKEVRRAAHQGTLTSEGLALAEGPHLLEEALRAEAEVLAVIVAESARTEMGSSHTRVLRVSDATFAGLASTESPQGVLALVRPPMWTFADLLRDHALVVVLDGIQDPGNAGAILRAAEAFGATGAVFLKGSVNPYNPKCLRGSAGSIFRLPLILGVTVEELVAKLSMPFYAADPRAPMLVADADLRASCALAIGSEGRGVSPALAARATGLRIPTSVVESLNAAVAAGILLYEARRRRST